MKRLLFVDDEPAVLRGLERQLHGMRHEWKMDFLDNGSKAMEFLSANPVDVIVTDLIMPGMDGMQLLTEVQTRYSNTVRLVLSGHADRDSVLKLVGPAHQYLSKPCNADELRGAIARSFGLSDLLSSEQLKNLAKKLTSLPILPSLHHELSAELSKEDSSLERISEIISQDIGIASKIMQLVNSAFFGRSQPVTEIEEAVQYLGITTVRALVLSLQIFAQYDQKNIKGFSIDALARHCWLVGTLARKIAHAERVAPKIDDQCFLSGLLHDIGQLILAANMPEQYSRMLEHARKESLTICEAERMEFGATHADVGGYLLSLWGLPAPVVEAVSLHHRPADSIAGGLSPVIAVHAANAFAHDRANNHAEWLGNRIDLAYFARAGLEKRLANWKLRCGDNY
jgi:HD-like signal output (HDOD) protein